MRIWNVRGDCARVVLDKTYQVKCQRAITAGGRAVRALQRDYRKRLTRTTSVSFTVTKVKG